jgi:hypothetical protein
VRIIFSEHSAIAKNFENLLSMSIFSAHSACEKQFLPMTQHAKNNFCQWFSTREIIFPKARWVFNNFSQKIKMANFSRTIDMFKNHFFCSALKSPIQIGSLNLKTRSPISHAPLTSHYLAQKVFQGLLAANILPRWCLAYYRTLRKTT